MKFLVSFTILSTALASSAAPKANPYESLRQEIRQSIARGNTWLKKQQKADGNWDDPELPAITALTLNALVAADSVLIPVQCEYLALEGITSLMETIERVRGALNTDLEIEGVLMTMYDDRTNLARQVVDEVRSVFKEQVYETLIPRNVRLGEAPSYGQPIFMYDIRSKGAEAYFTLAKEFLKHEAKGVGQRAEQSHSRGAEAQARPADKPSPAGH